MQIALTAVSLLACAMLGPETTLERKGGSGTPAKFGYVLVDDRDTQAALEEGLAADRAARDVLGISNAKFRIADPGLTNLRWGEPSPDGLPSYVWLFANSPGSKIQAPPSSLLRHEIGHDLFIRHLVPSTRADQYGGDAPDWLDEMAAIAFESETMRDSRRRAAVRYAREKKLIPMRRFLSMTHPELEASASLSSSNSLATAFEPASSETPLFYATASAFHEFLLAHTGSQSIVVELATAFREKKDLQAWILTRLRQRNGLEGLDEEFSQWIASDPRYGGRSQQVK